MASAGEETIFRVRAAGSDHWVVYRDTASEPVASFSDKASALAYALHLARTPAARDPVGECQGNVIRHRGLSTAATTGKRAPTPR